MQSKYFPSEIEKKWLSSAKASEGQARKRYDPSSIEKKWQEIWHEEGIYEPDMDMAKEPFFNLMMFPYPSAEGLHVGNMYAFTGSDIIGRFHRMHGKDVLEPIGLDGFGIHSENYALKVGRTPQEHAGISEANFYRQLHMIGNGFSWSHKVETYDPNYYKWTQWLFIELFKKGLAYRKKAPVNYCPKDKTVLADEQVIDGKCERCGTEVEKRNLEQWFFKITEYADRLLSNIKDLDWSEKVKIAQRNWIGKKEGIEITYDIENSKEKVTVFTTRPDTNYGATFIAIAPEHPLVDKITTSDQKKAVDEYKKEASPKSDIERQSEGKEKTGVFTGSYAINQLTGYKMPIWVSDFVLIGFGTGALVGVPGHDKRDFAFAKKYNIPVKLVVIKKGVPFRSYVMGVDSLTDEELEHFGITVFENKEGIRKIEIPKEQVEEYKKFIKEKLQPGFWNEIVGEYVWFVFKDKNGQVKEYILDEENKLEIAQKCSEYNNDPIEQTSNIWLYLASNDWYQDAIIQEEEGTMINSDFLNGMDIHEATEKIMDYMEQKGWGKRVSTYHLRDWLISRQRYWGPPIPMIYCEKCDWQPVSEESLPVLLPETEDWKPTGTGVSPLAALTDWVQTTCPNCKGPARRETDVSDTFLDSSWYFFRYTSNNFADKPFDKLRIEKWLPVHLYTGGAEHSVLHLLYSRFVTMVLKDKGFIDFEEPFARFRAHGLIIKDGAKMSKSKGNVINPDEYIKKFGADTLRTYLMFLGPFSQGGDFRDSGIEGMYRFLRRVWTLVVESRELKAGSQNPDENKIQRKMHWAIKKVTEDIERLNYNTAIAAIMEYFNELFDFYTKYKTLNIKYCETLILLLAPFAPHMTEELWQRMISADNITDLHGSAKISSKNPWKSIHKESWPVYDENYLVAEEVTIAVQINGKTRGTISIPSEESSNKEKVIETAKSEENISKHLKGKSAKNIIYVLGKIINFVV